MADVIDELEIRIGASSNKAEKSINNLADKLDKLSASIQNVQTNGINNLAKSITNLSASMQDMNSLKTTDFTRLAKNITKLSVLNTSGIYNVSRSLNQIVNSFNRIGAVSQNAQIVGVLASNISKLGYKKVTDAITNLPKLTIELNNLLVTLSKSPTVSSNVIQMTNALANLATQGSKVGASSSSLVRGLNRYTTASSRASKSTFSLAAAFGKFYASYFLIIRGLKGVWSSIESTANYIEAYNYYNVAFGKIASDWESDWEKYGYENGYAYAQSFTDRMNDVMSKFSGVQIDLDTGLFTETGLKNLGMNIQEVTQFASQLASVTNSVGQVGEVSLATAESLTMLAGDISSLFNMDFKDVAKNLQSGLIGQSRALYRYGIDITNATLQTYAYGLGLEKSVSEMTQAEKMQLRLIAILDQSKVSWGDLANTIQSPSNQIRMLTNNMSELGMVFGQLFIPMLSKVLPYVNGLTIALKRLFVNLASFMGIDIDLDDFGQGYNDSLDDTADGFDEVADSIEKTNNALRGFDELKTISSANTVSLSGVDETGNTIDLTDEIKKASDEYQRVWNEAFANMENKANDLADSISEAFSFDEIAKGVSEFLTTVERFSEVISPFTKGFGDGFLGFFESLAGMSLELFVDGLNALSEVIGLMPEELLESVGEKLGILVGSIVTLSGIKNISTALSNLSSGLGTLGRTLTGNPILSTFVLAAGILSLIDIADKKAELEVSVEMGDLIDDLEELDASIGETKSSLKDIKDAFTDIDNQELAGVYAKWQELNNKVGELTDSEKGLLKAYADRIKELFPQAKSYIDENGRAYEGLVDNLDDAIQKAILLSSIQATDELTQDAVKLQIQAEVDLDSAEKAIDEIVDYFKEQFPELTDSEITGMLENYYKTGNLYVPGTLKSPIKVAQERNPERIGSMDWLVGDVTHYQKLQKLQKEAEKYSDALKMRNDAEEVLREAEKELNSIIEKSIELNKKYSETFIGTEENASSLNKSLLGMADGSIPDLADKLGLVTGAAEEAVISIGEIATAIDKLNKKEINFKMVDLSDTLPSGVVSSNYTPIDTSKFDKSWKSNLPKLPMPTATNDVIQDAVNKGVKNAIQNGTIGVDVKIEIEPNENGIVNAAIKGINQRTKATGRTPIALAY